MKKTFCLLLMLLSIGIFFAFSQKVDAEIIRAVNEPYTYYEDMDFLEVYIGYDHSLAINSEGRIFTWGCNMYGQLGDGTGINKSVPTEITNQFGLLPSETITQVSLGNSFSAAITSSGRIFTWGYNWAGQLGDSTTDNKFTPTEITNQFSLLPGETITQVALGDLHSSATTSSGRIFTWGINWYGQLGDGTTDNKSVPTEITNQFSLFSGETITQVSLADYHSSAITSSGRIFTWGANWVGQLGDGTTIDKSTPTEITNQLSLFSGETVTQVSLGYDYSSAITSRGRIFTWGYNFNGQLGDGSWTNKSTPIEITNQFSLFSGETITQVALGYTHSAAITSIGRIFTWGYNLYGQLGDGTTDNQSVPTEITNQFSILSGEIITQVSLGYEYSSGITSSGRIFTWGRNDNGQLGDSTTINKSIPREIGYNIFNIIRNPLPASENITQVFLGYGYSSAITSSGRIFTWGSNWYGQLGDGTSTDILIPTEITHQFGLLLGETITQVSLGYGHSAAITSSGRIFTWGNNWDGQLGDGTTDNQSVPTEITHQFSLLSGETITQVSLGYTNSAAITSSGRIFIWGYNLYDQLGDGTIIDKSTPTEITHQFSLFSGETITQVSIGSEYSSAITSSGRIFTWGRNDFGQLGDGTTIDKSTPTEITNRFGLLSSETITQVFFGSDFSSAITSEGRIFTWGYNGFGQLGYGTTTEKSTPIDITAQFSLNVGEAIIEVSLGGNHSSAITSSGRIFTWGENYYGQLGDDTRITKYTPIEINKIYSVPNEIYLTIADEFNNHLKPDLKVTIFPKYDVTDEIISVNINGIEYTNLISEFGRIDVYIPNSWALNDTVNFTANSITFASDLVMTLTGDVTASTTLVEDTWDPTIIFDYENELYIEENVGNDSYIQATAIDDTEDIVDIVIIGTVNWTTPGEYQLTFTATDTSGNTTSRQRTIYIMNEINTSGTIEYSMTFYNFEEETISPSLNLTNQIIRYNFINYYSLTDNSAFIYEIGWNEIPFEFYIDNRLVIASKKVYYYEDTTPPAFDLIPDQTIEAGEYANIDWTTYMTNVSDDSGFQVSLFEVEDNVVYDLPGLYTVVLMARDESGNETLATLNITVRDTVLPTVSLNPSLDTIKQGSVYVEYSVTVNDVTDTVVLIEGAVDINTPGVYQLIYRVTDTSGNKTVVKRYVTVYPASQNIRFELGEANTTLKVGEEYIDGTCVIYINEEPFNCAIKENTVNNLIPGLYTITYAYTYQAKEYTYKRYVFVVDGETPLIVYVSAKKEEGIEL